MPHGRHSVPPDPREQDKSGKPDAVRAASAMFGSVMAESLAVFKDEFERQAGLVIAHAEQEIRGDVKALKTELAGKIDAARRNSDTMIAQLQENLATRVGEAKQAHDTAIDEKLERAGRLLDTTLEELKQERQQKLEATRTELEGQITGFETKMLQEIAAARTKQEGLLKITEGELANRRDELGTKMSAQISAVESETFARLEEKADELKRRNLVAASLLQEGIDGLRGKVEKLESRVEAAERTVEEANEGWGRAQRELEALTSVSIRTSDGQVLNGAAAFALVLRSYEELSAKVGKLEKQVRLLDGLSDQVKGLASRRFETAIDNERVREAEREAGRASGIAEEALGKVDSVEEYLETRLDEARAMFGDFVQESSATKESAERAEKASAAAQETAERTEKALHDSLTPPPPSVATSVDIPPHGAVPEEAAIMENGQSSVDNGWVQHPDSVTRSDVASPQVLSSAERTLQGLGSLAVEIEERDSSLLTSADDIFERATLDIEETTLIRFNSALNEAFAVLQEAGLIDRTGPLESEEGNGAKPDLHSVAEKARLLLRLGEAQQLLSSEDASFPDQPSLQDVQGAVTRMHSAMRSRKLC